MPLASYSCIKRSDTNLVIYLIEQKCTSLISQLTNCSFTGSTVSKLVPLLVKNCKVCMRKYTFTLIYIHCVMLSQETCIYMCITGQTCCSTWLYIYPDLIHFNYTGNTEPFWLNRSKGGIQTPLALIGWVSEEVTSVVEFPLAVGLHHEWIWMLVVP